MREREKQKGLDEREDIECELMYCKCKIYNVSNCDWMV